MRQYSRDFIKLISNSVMSIQIWKLKALQNWIHYILVSLLVCSSSIHSLCCMETFRNSAAFRSCNYSIQGAKGSPPLTAVATLVSPSTLPPPFTSYSAGWGGRAVFCRGLNDSWMFDKYLCLRESRRRSIAGSLLRRWSNGAGGGGGGAMPCVYIIRTAPKPLKCFL